MANLYARQSVLRNLKGRIYYLSSPEKQEVLLAVHDGAADLLDGQYWKQLVRECEDASKYTSNGKKNVQARELVVHLSNALLKRLSADEIAKTVAEEFEKKYGRPCYVAAHLKSKKTGKDNLHVHIVYSERELLPEIEEKTATRKLFFDENGVRHYKKSEILNEDGELRKGCYEVAKGEVYERKCFGSVDESFSSKEWLKKAKSEWVLPLRNGILKGDIEITEFDPSTGQLPQQHVGNKAPEEVRARIKAYNSFVKRYNELISKGYIPAPMAKDIQKRISCAKDKNGFLYKTLEKISLIIEQIRVQKAIGAPVSKKETLNDKILAAEQKTSQNASKGAQKSFEKEK